MINEVTPDSSSFFEQIRQQAKTIERQVEQLDKMRQKRIKLYHDCMNQYQRYIAKQNDLIDKNIKHCQTRNKWYREEVNKSWATAVSNRDLVLKSVARTNVLKKDFQEWVGRINQDPEDSHRRSFEEESVRQSLEGSKLIDKYNQILMEYGHKI